MNFGVIFKAIGIALQAYFNPTPKEAAVEKALQAFLGELWPAVTYNQDYPRARQLENAAVALALAVGATVHLDPATGHVVTVIPPVPVSTYVAPAHQSPSDFNAHNE